MNGRHRSHSRTTLLAFAITALLILPVVFALTSGVALAASVEPVVVSGNPTCGDLNANDTDFPSITTDFEFKIDGIGGNAFDGVYQRVEANQNGFPTELLGGAPANPSKTITISNSDSNSFDFASNYGITAVIVKAANEGNVYVYTPASFGDSNLESNTGQDISNVKFCFGPDPATLRARKYNDLNMNGAWDDGEPYLEGWTINVYDGQGVFVDSKMTDVEGWAEWEVPPGDYTVCEVLQDHWVNTQAGALTPGIDVNGEVCSQQQALQSGDDWSFLFGNYELPRLRVLKYNDLNMDGQRQNFGDNPEVGLEDWTMNVYDGDGLPVDSQMTGANGYYTWRVPPGDYTVCEELQSGWVNTQAGDLTPGTVDNGEVCSHEQTIMPGELYEFAFGNYEEPQLATLRVRKYYDENMNGERDQGEPYLEGWTMKVFDADDKLVDTQQTDADGWYVWQVPVGDYTVCEELKPGWVNTQAGNLKPGVAVNGYVCSQEQLVENDWTFLFGNYEEPQLATLRVRKYYDENMNGKHDSGEPWLQGWTMKVFDADDKLVDTQQTDADGWYVWQVPIGDYTACEELKPGWVNTQAGNLKPGNEVNGYVCSQEQTVEDDWTFLFGNYEEPPPAGFCPDDDPYVDYELTDVLGVGMGSMSKAVRTRRLNIPDWQNVNELYGQIAAMEIGRIRFVRFRYPDKTYIQIKQPTSPAFHQYAIKWWGTDLEPAKYIKGQIRWIRDGRRAPRAFVLWPTYATTELYANVFEVFDKSEENHVFWDDRPQAAYLWYPEQTQVLELPATQEPGADIVVKMALVDNNDDNRPVIVTVSANGVSEQRVIYGPNRKDTLNLETFLLENVPAGTDEVVIHLLSPDPSNEYPDGGDSVAIIGAAASYVCVEDNFVNPTITGYRR